MQSKTSLIALCSLLDDPDESVYHRVKHELIHSELNNVEVKLKDLRYDESLSRRAVKRIDEVIDCIYFKTLSETIQCKAEANELGLQEGLSWFIKFRYKDYSTEVLDREIRDYAAPIWLEVSEKFTGLEKVNMINSFLFHRGKIAIKKLDACLPGSFFVNDLLINGKANELSITALYLLICQYLELPVDCVKVKSKYFIGYRNLPALAKSPGFGEFMFYINPGNNGLILGGDEVEWHFDHKGYEISPVSDYSPFIASLFRELALSYERSNNHVKKSQCEELASILG